MRAHALILTAALTHACASSTAQPDPDDTAGDPTFRIALFADTHIIDDDYECCENSPLDTETITRTVERLAAVRATLGAIRPAPAFGVNLGDVFHQAYKRDTVADYAQPDAAPAIAASMLREFPFPVHIAWGNHDYGVPRYSREFTHDIFDQVFDSQPTTVIEQGGWRFILANSQLGSTWDEDSPLYNRSLGSFGAEQLAEMDALLSDGTPTLLFFHHPPFVCARDEAQGPTPDILSLVERHKATVKGVFTGHTHRWIDLGATWNDEVPTWVVGATRYGPHNFWILDLTEGTDTYEIVDFDRVHFNDVGADPWDPDVHTR